MKFEVVNIKKCIEQHFFKKGGGGKEIHLNRKIR